MNSVRRPVLPGGISLLCILQLLFLCRGIALDESSSQQDWKGTPFSNGRLLLQLYSDKEGEVTLKIKNQTTRDFLFRSDLQEKIEHQRFGLPVSIFIQTTDAEGKVIVPETLSAGGWWNSAVVSSDPISDSMKSYQTKDYFVGWKNEIDIRFNFKELRKEAVKRYFNKASGRLARWRFKMEVRIEGHPPLIIESDWATIEK